MSLNGLALPPRPSSDRGELVELGADTFTPLEQAIHFFSYRVGERQLPKVRAFRNWLFATAQVPAPE